MRDTWRPSAWIVSSRVRRPWMWAIAAPALTASTYCCATPAMSSCGGPRWVWGGEVRESPATVMISLSIGTPSRVSRFRHGFDLAAPGRPNDGIEHRHAVEHIVERDREGSAVAYAAAERGELCVQHVEAGVLDDLVRRGPHGAGGRAIRAWHEAKPLQVRPRHLGEALGAVDGETEIRGGGDRAEDRASGAAGKAQKDRRRIVGRTGAVAPRHAAH